MALIKYDMEKEMEREKERVSKILEKFPEVGGLENILNQTLDLYNLKTFQFYVKNARDVINNLDKLHKNSLDPNFLKKEFPLFNYATILKRSKIKIIYVPSLWSDTILFEHFWVFFSFCSYIISLEKNVDISEDFSLTERVMDLGYDFDKNIDFNPIDEDFFKKLKSIKWNKKAEKLFEKIYSIHTDMIDYIAINPFSLINLASTSSNRFILTFLVACSAVNNDSDCMMIEDVIMGFKTFYKFFNINIE
ncbi:hypothetical protein [Methanobrevibacter sp.]|uniref:hypothetical protein n=1 Tax=Methanobrevibacter sp. TaxID=66852 RepID=UPI0026274689|nr:hypothetical protein [uncultured Methanobrevibacter sp.]